MVASRFPVTVLLALENTWLHSRRASDLQGAFAPLRNPWTSEEIGFACQFVPLAHLEDEVRRLMASGQRNLIAVSDGLIVPCHQNRWCASAVAERLRRFAWEGHGYCALVAVHETAPATVPEIDAVVGDLGQDPFRQQLETVALGLWYRLPPASLGHRPLGEHLTIDFVRTREDLRDCLQLRFTVYRLLGHLPPDLLNGPAEIELDGYDPNAIHFIARVGGEIAACMRLILPSRNLPRSIILEGELQIPQPDIGGWLHEFARPSVTLRSRLAALDPMATIPAALLKAFNAFTLNVDVARSGSFQTTRHYCEISRNITAPKYRGLGISGLLMEKALAAAAGLRRRHMVLECGLHHRGYYEQFGFKGLGSLETGAVEPAETLNCLAMIMHRDLRDITAGTPEPSAPARNTRKTLRVAFEGKPNFITSNLDLVMDRFLADLPPGVRAEKENPLEAAVAKGMDAPATVLLHACKDTSIPALAGTLVMLLTHHGGLGITVRNAEGGQYRCPPFEGSPNEPPWEDLCKELTRLLNPP